MKKYIANAAAFIICGTFCFSAVTKILFWSFTLDIMQQLLLNYNTAVISSILLILLESMIAISIFKSNYWKYLGCLSAAILFIFTSIVIWAKRVDRISECPCFGKFFGSEIGITLAIRNAILIGWSILLAIYGKYAVINEKNE